MTRAEVNAYLDHLQDAGLAPSTVSLRWRNLRPFFAWWANETDRPNPFDGTDQPRAAPPPPDVLAPEDVRALLATCGGRSFEDRRDRAVILTLLDTGARRGELTGLRTDDWDRRTDLLTLDGKTGLRVVPVSPPVGEALARYLRSRADHPQAGLEWMWLGKRGRLGESGVAQILARRGVEAGLGRINPHRLRHSWAHYFRAAGGSEGDLMYLAGWKTAAMAHRYGASAAAERAREAARKLSLVERVIEG